MRTHYCGDVTAASIGNTVTVSGWVHRRRDHGGVIFIDLRDREGLVQVVCDPDREQTFRVAEGVRNEFCLKITGKVRARPAGTANTNITSGSVEVRLSIRSSSPPWPGRMCPESLSPAWRLSRDSNRSPKMLNAVSNTSPANRARSPGPLCSASAPAMSWAWSRSSACSRATAR